MRRELTPGTSCPRPLPKDIVVGSLDQRDVCGGLPAGILEPEEMHFDLARLRECTQTEWSSLTG